MIVFSCIRQFRLKIVTIFYRSSMEQKTQFSNNLIQLDIVYPRTLEWVKVLLIFFPTESQHAVILESIWETDLNITHFPVQRTGRLTPLLTCLLYFSLLLGQNYSKSNSLSPFFFFGQKFSKSNSSFLFSLGENFLSPIPLLSSLGRNYSKSNFNSTKFF